MSIKFNTSGSSVKIINNVKLITGGINPPPPTTTTPPGPNPVDVAIPIVLPISNLPVPASGSSNVVNNVAWYRFNITTTKTINVNTIGSNNGNYLETKIALYNSTGFAILEDANSGGNGWSSYTTTLLPGTYYIAAGLYNIFFNNSFIASGGQPIGTDIVLSAETLAGPVDVAVPVVLPVTNLPVPVSGSSNVFSNVAWYSFEVAADGNFEISTIGSNGGNYLETTLALYNSSGTVLGQDTASGGNGWSLYTSNVLSPSTYYVAVGIPYLDINDRFTAVGSSPIGTDIVLNIELAPVFMGIWDPITNSPPLNNNTGKTGDQYISKSPATVDLGSGNISLDTGDMLSYDGTQWNKIPAGSAGTSIKPMGMWSPGSNNPTLSNGGGGGGGGGGVPGDQYIATSAGTANFGAGPVSFLPGDYAMYDGSQWQRMPAYAAGSGSPIVFTVDSSLVGNTVSIPVGLQSVFINWGDGTSSYPTYTASHTYTTAGIYQINIFAENTFSTFATNSESGIISVESFGNVGLTSISLAEQKFLTAVPNYLPSGVISLEGMFVNAQLFNSDISNWNTSNVTSMRNMFYQAADFNQNIDSWNTSKVTNMQGMFHNATSFNQSLNNWDTSKVTNMSFMFSNASAFNGDITDWNTSSVTAMNNMFEVADSFNQPIGAWDTSSVTNMAFMFGGTLLFNQDISGWDTSNVNNMQGMFNDTYAFNQAIGSWNTSSVLNMDLMFHQAYDFSQDISGWDVTLIPDYPDIAGGNCPIEPTWNDQLHEWEAPNLPQVWKDSPSGWGHWPQPV